jgi:hypothetical protein
MLFGNQEYRNWTTFQMNPDESGRVFVTKVAMISGDYSGTFVIGQEEKQAKCQKKGD